MKFLSLFLVFTLSFSTDELVAQGTTSRISLSSSSIQGNAASSWPALSNDARFVSFISSANNLVSGDTNNTADIFVRDRVLNITSRVSINSFGIEANAISRSPSISEDGRFIAFISEANNLVVGDNNGVADVFVHDRNTANTTRVSVDSSGAENNGFSYITSISANGQFVAFHSVGSTLVNADTNGVTDVFVHDRNTGTTSRVSVQTSGVEGNSHSELPSISADGRFVAFISRASNMVSGDTNATEDVFLHDRTTATTSRLSVNSSGTESNGRSFWPSISEDGRFIAFYSSATNLVPADTNGDSDIFVRDTVSNQTTRISIDSSGLQSTGGDSYEPSISNNGQFIAYRSASNSLINNDTNNLTDVFLFDRISMKTTRVSINSSGIESDGFSFESAISGNGKYIAFSSSGTNLVNNDTNGNPGPFGPYDVFIHKQFIIPKSESIPTLDTWGLFALSLFLIVFALRRKQIKN